MSRSNPQLTNPAGRFFEWSGSTGTLNFYDKEKQERINVPLPFSFLPLDELSTMVGYSKRDESGYWSNEIRNITKDTLIVRTKHGIAEQGLYNELANVRSKGAKYAKSIYIAYKTREGWEIGNIKAHGSALSAWIEFSKTCRPENGKVTMTKGEAQDAPTGQFFAPVFTYEASSKDEDIEAFELDKQLQTYLEQYLKQPPITDVEDEIVNGTTHEVITTDELEPPQRPSRSEGGSTGDAAHPAPVTTQATENPQSATTGYEKAKAAADKIKEKNEDAAIRELLQQQHEEAIDQQEFDPSEIPF
jgi:hypothetical protein